jgi:hypothetical protein
MRLLGPAVLRIGGNSVDTSWWTSNGEPPPIWATGTVTPADLLVLHGLLAATGWRVLLGVNLGHFEPARAADEVHYARAILGGELMGVEIGNEPNAYGNRKDNLRSPTYGVSEYFYEAEAYYKAISTTAPGTPVDGPAWTQQTPWLANIVAFAHTFVELTLHYYPVNNCPASTPSNAVFPPTTTELLSPAVRQQENEALAVFSHAGAVTGRPIRIGETGSGGCSGNAYASPVFASALWSLDWTLRAASSGIQGLNFHGHLGICGPYNQSPVCELAAQPEYYGLLAARQLEGGRFVPTQVVAPATPETPPNLTTWATLTPDRTVKVVIDNFATESPAQLVSISVPDYTAVNEEALVASAAGARNKIALGAAPVNLEGRWRPKPVRLLGLRRPLRVVVQPASAVIVTLSPHRSLRSRRTTMLHRHAR